MHPLSISYTLTQKHWMKFWRFLYLIIILIILVPADLYAPTENLPFRLSFYADRIRDDTVSLSGVTSITLTTTGCLIKILEHTDSSSFRFYSSVDFFVGSYSLNDDSAAVTLTVSQSVARP